MIKFINFYKIKKKYGPIWAPTRTWAPTRARAQIPGPARAQIRILSDLFCFLGQHLLFFSYTSGRANKKYFGRARY